MTINKISKFIKRLFIIVSDESLKDISWSEDGKAICIKNKEEFMKNALPFLSKTKEYSAFIRQLNLYGFIKVKGSSHYEEYFHSSFQKGREDLLSQVKHDRDKSINVYDAKQYLTDIDPRYKEAIECLSMRNFRLEEDVCLLRDRVEKQENTINGLIEILSRMFQCSKPEENTLKITNQQNIEDLRLGKYNKMNQNPSNQLLFDNPSSQNIYQLARNNFEINNKSSNQLIKPNELKGKSVTNHRALRNEIFGESDEIEEDLFGDNFF